MGVGVKGYGGGRKREGWVIETNNWFHGYKEIGANLFTDYKYDKRIGHTPGF